MLPQSYDVGIIGAGAAGLATALFLKRLSPGTSICLLDGAKHPGAKILVSGGGRCNVTNRHVESSDFWGGPRTIVRRVLRSLPTSQAIAFFEELGVPLHEEADGKMFPRSNRARDVLDALLADADARGVSLRAMHRVLDVSVDGGTFRIDTTQGGVFAKVVVVATGGCSLPKSGSDGAGYAIAVKLGHTITPTTPALVPLLLSDEATANAPGGSPHRAISGVSQLAQLTVWVDGSAFTRLTGSLLWTHFGISGPAALDASRHWALAALHGRTASITASFCPDRERPDVDAQLLALAASRPRASAQTLLAGLVPSRFASALLAYSGVPSDAPLSQLPRDARRQVAQSLVEWRFAVTGTRGYQYAEVTAGGVSLTEVEAATLESRRCRGLYLVGEVLDVDGPIGGYNFQWAWASGRTAAEAIAKRLSV